MKRIITFLFATILSFAIFAQAPNAFNYQGLARDISGNPVKDKSISLRVSIVQGNTSGTEVYKEIHQIVTNNVGLFSIQIGKGTPVSGMIESISWGSGPFFLKVEMDDKGGSNFQLIGASQLLSVPYALYAGKSGDALKLMPPTVVATSVTNVNLTSATLNGTVNGNGFKTDVSFEWGTTLSFGNTIKAIQDPVVGSDIVSVSANLTGLTQYTKYYFRIKASNAVNTLASNEISFSTGLAIPQVSTAQISMISINSAQSGGTILSNGGAVISALGVCWNTTGTPTITDNKTSDGIGTVAFTSNITGLTPNTKYYVRAYAANSEGTGYGDQKSFTTNPIPPTATVTTDNVTEFTFNSAKVGGNVTNEGTTSVTERGIVYGTSINPTISSNKLIIGSGLGKFNVSISNLSSNTTYYVRAYATNSSGISYGNEVSFTLYLNIPGPSVTDIDGNTYKTVKIGNQIWMAENLKTTKYQNGEPIPNVKDHVEWRILSTAAYCDYSNNVSYSTVYGRIYNWYAVNESRKICPVGWHAPIDPEWQTLGDYLGGSEVAGGKLKETGTTHWNTPNQDATNISGFTALPGGSLDYTSGSYNLGLFGHWWSASDPNSFSAWRRDLSYATGALTRWAATQTYGFYVRCVKD